MFPQLAVMDERIEQHNAMYAVLMSSTVERLEALKKGSSTRVYFIPQAEGSGNGFIIFIGGFETKAHFGMV